MKNSGIGRILVGVALFVPALGAAAPVGEPLQSFHYWVRLPHMSATTCQNAAQAMAVRFSEATSLQVTEAKCLGTVQLPSEGKTYTMDSIDLTYFADEARTPYTAVFGSGDHSVDPRDSDGAYSTFADCLEDLPVQSRLFEKNTSIKILSAVCELGADQFSHSTVLKIAGFGEPVRRLKAAEFDFYGKPDADFLRQGLALFSKYGATIVRSWGVNLLYYSEKYVPVQERRIVSFGNAAQCEPQLEELHTILAANGATNVIVACLPIAIDLLKGHASMEAIDDSGAFLTSDFGYGSPRYYSFEECQHDRPRAIQDAFSKGEKPLGGICHPAETSKTQYVLELFKRL